MTAITTVLSDCPRRRLPEQDTRDVSARGGSMRIPGMAGFTLFEVAISLVILAFGVVSIMTLFPAGLRAQQLSRFQLYAAAKAEEMVEQFNTAHFDNATADTEGTECWNAASSYRSQTWDLDARVASHRYGMMPLPLELARRIDSDGDEIQQILSQGGYVYYSQPTASTGTEEQGMAVAPPTEAQKLIIGITGYAQQNAMPIFPMKNWPYQASFPSPPVHYNHMRYGWMPAEVKTGANYQVRYDHPRSGSENVTEFWESARLTGVAIPGTDPDLQKIVDWPETGGPSGVVHYGYMPYANGLQWENGNNPTKLGNDDGIGPTRDGALRYVQAALWYCQRKSTVTGSRITSAFWSDPHTSGIPTFEPGTDDDKKWMQVQAMRFLAHAATCLTAWYPLNSADTSKAESLSTGVKIPAVTIDGLSIPEFVITNELIRYYHERCLKLAMSFAASFPYDWAVPRRVERTISLDYPLLQYDLFTPVLEGPLFGAGKNAKQWRPLAPRPIRHLGLSAIYPENLDSTGKTRLDSTMVRSVGSTLFGDIDHYSLAMPFEPSQRCREIVFWCVDWQSYEDFETLPSAPVDASRYPIAGPRTDAGGAMRDFNGRMSDVDFVDPHLFCFRNPEKNMLWMDDIPRTSATGTDVTSHQVLNSDNADQGPGLNNRKVFAGQFGADRNYNKKIDRGNVPPSVRLRATQVARFNYYDPRIPCLLR
jgi:type II secretory pathway pseudopilin PulG